MLCPLCNETDMVEIWYGYPTPDLIDMSRADLIVLGGWPEKPYTHYCQNCQETYPFIETSYEE